MLNPDYRDILSCLKRAEARFLVVGAYAMAAHGYPRATGDIDLWVEADTANAQRVHAALVAFGAPVQQVTLEDLATVGNVIQIGVVPCRVDILTGIDGVDFASAWERRIGLTVDGIAIDVLSIDDLITNKSVTGRDKDALDVALLKRLPR